MPFVYESTRITTRGGLVWSATEFDPEAVAITAPWTDEISGGRGWHRSNEARSMDDVRAAYRERSRLIRGAIARQAEQRARDARDAEKRERHRQAYSANADEPDWASRHRAVFADLMAKQPDDPMSPAEGHFRNIYLETMRPVLESLAAKIVEKEQQEWRSSRAENTSGITQVLQRLLAELDNRLRMRGVLSTERRGQVAHELMPQLECWAVDIMNAELSIVHCIVTRMDPAIAPYVTIVRSDYRDYTQTHEYCARPAGVTEAEFREEMKRRSSRSARTGAFAVDGMANPDLRSWVREMTSDDVPSDAWPFRTEPKVDPTLEIPCARSTKPRWQIINDKTPRHGRRKR